MSARAPTNTELAGPERRYAPSLATADVSVVASRDRFPPFVQADLFLRLAAIAGFVSTRQHFVGNCLDRE
jgi:hypothetical protein